MVNHKHYKNDIINWENSELINVIITVTVIK